MGAISVEGRLAAAECQRVGGNPTGAFLAVWPARAVRADLGIDVTLVDWEVTWTNCLTVLGVRRLRVVTGTVIAGSAAHEEEDQHGSACRKRGKDGNLRRPASFGGLHDELLIWGWMEQVEHAILGNYLFSGPYDERRATT